MSCALLYTGLTPAPQVAHAQRRRRAGRQGPGALQRQPCVTCHGSNLQGVQDHGPSLIGVGQAAVYFQVSSGRMPLARQEAQAIRKPPLPTFDPATEEGAANLEALGAYIQANGGGPARPGGHRRRPARRRPGPRRRAVPAQLRLVPQLHRARRRAVVGQVRPARSTRRRRAQIYTAMLTGPQNMPKFTDRQLSPEEKKDIIAYIKSVEGDYNNPGGNPLGGIGPVSEGVVAFIVGLAGLIGFASGWGPSRDHLAPGRPGPDDAARPRRATSAAAAADRRRAGGHVPAGAGAARRRARRRRDRPQHPAVAGAGHPRRAARRARGRAVVHHLGALGAGVPAGCYLFWPFEYVAPGRPGYWTYALYTPLIGGFFGLCVLTLGIAVISYVKKFFPDEVSVQQRHDGPSDELARKTVDRAARRGGQGHRHRAPQADHPLGGRRGGHLRPRPRRRRDRPARAQPVEGRPQGRAVDHRLGARLPRRGRLHPRSTPATPTRSSWSAPRTRARAPCRRCSRSASPSATTSRRSPRRSSAPTTRSMLIRLRPGTPVIQAPGQENLPLRRLLRLLEDLHAPGLPDVALRGADQPHPLPVPPVAVHRDRVRQAGVRSRGRPLPQLPITVNDEGYLVATGDFTGPIGPAFWELGSKV